MAAKKQVLWFAGDVGVSRSLPLFHQRHQKLDLTWIATGMGDLPNDLLLEVQVDKSGRVHPKIRRVDGKASKPLASFGLEHWRATFGKD